MFNSDNAEFGGSGITNGTVTAKEQPMHDEAYRITLDIPPMSVMYFKPKNIRSPEDDRKKAEEAKKAAEEKKAEEKKPEDKKSEAKKAEKAAK